MVSGKRIPGGVWPSLMVSVLVLGLAACGDKPPPAPTAKPLPLAVQPEPKKEEMKTAEPRPASVPAPAPANADEVLAAKVKDALGADSSINVHRIDVTAGDGVVTLYGTADTPEQRAKAERVAAGVAGVKSVENQLAIVAGS